MPKPTRTTTPTTTPRMETRVEAGIGRGMHRQELAPAAYRSAIRAAFDSVAVFTAAGKGAGPAAPLHQRQRPRYGRYGASAPARSRVQAPRRTY
ncbi:hypothetical protein [Streptomyces sp. NPDC001919]